MTDLLSTDNEMVFLLQLVRDIYFRRFYDNFRFGPDRSVHKNLYVYRFDHVSELSSVRRCHLEQFDSWFHNLCKFRNSLISGVENTVFSLHSRRYSRGRTEIFVLRHTHETSPIGVYLRGLPTESGDRAGDGPHLQFVG